MYVAKTNSLEFMLLPCLATPKPTWPFRAGSSHALPNHVKLDHVQRDRAARFHPKAKTQGLV